MPERATEGSVGRVDLADTHAALEAAHAEVLTDPRHQAEGLDGASCGPHIKHLAELASAAAEGGVSASQWRADVLSEAGPSATGALERFGGLHAPSRPVALEPLSADAPGIGQVSPASVGRQRPLPLSSRAVAPLREGWLPASRPISGVRPR